MPDGSTLTAGFTALCAAAFGIYNWQRGRMADKRAQEAEDKAEEARKTAEENYAAAASRNDLKDLRDIIRDQANEIRDLKEENRNMDGRIKACEAGRSELKEELFKTMTRMLRLEDQLRSLATEA